MKTTTPMPPGLFYKGAASSAGSSGSALALIADGAFRDYAVDTRLVTMAAVPMVLKDSLTGEGAPIAEEAAIETLLAEGFSSPQDAFAKMYGVFGMTLYASKPALCGLDVDAETGEVKQMGPAVTFTIREIVMVEHGGFKKDDAWLLKIATANGESKMLTFERNEGRDKFLFYYAAVLRRFGEGVGEPCILERVEKADGTAFYLIVPARTIRTDGVSAIDAQFTAK